MSKLFEEQTPNWAPNECAFGYHAITYGLLLSQLVQRADPKHRVLPQYFADEILAGTGKLVHNRWPAIIHNVDVGEIYMGGVTSSDRVARMRTAGWRDFLAHTVCSSWQALYFHVCTPYTNALYARALTNPHWLLPGVGHTTHTC
jgi:hypothetical protein